MRSLSLRVGVLLAAILATFVVVGAPATYASTIPATQFSPATMTDIPQPIFLLTQTDGGVTVGCSSPEGVNEFKTFAPNGTVIQSRPAPTNYATGTMYNMCPRNAVVGADGTLYTLGYTSNFAVAKLEAIKNNVSQWSYTLPCGATSMPGLVVGLNGNLYMTVRGTHSPCAANLLLGLTPTGTVVLNQALAVSGYVLEGGISAYNGGVVVRTNTDIQYITYAGAITPYAPPGVQSGPYGNYTDTTLAGRTLVSLAATQTNKDLCGDQAISGGLHAYQPSGSVWSYNSLPACSVAYEMKPTPSGGFIVRYSTPEAGIPGNTREQFMLALDDSGHALWTAPLASTDPSIYTMSLTFAVDLNGNVAVQRVIQHRLSANGTYYPFPAVQFSYVDGFTGVVLTSREISGDHDTPGGDGYILSGAGNYELDIAKNTWYVALAHCTTWPNCNYTQSTLYAVTVPGLQMDYPRGAVLAANKPWKSFVVLGDSFSSGEGSGDYDPTTNIPSNQTAFNECHRSAHAYYHWLDGALGARMEGGGFLACSGAKTSHLTNVDQYGNQPAQAQLLSPNADFVILTIGGNDIGFGNFAKQCIISDCSSVHYSDVLSSIANDLPIGLANAYGAIHDHVGSHTRVLVLGYPMIVPEPNSQLTHCGEINAAEMLAVRDVITHLNGAIRTAVEVKNQESGANGPRFEFVSVVGTDSPFNGHEICTSDSYLNSIELLSGSVDSQAVESYHPNTKGQEAYATSVKTYLSVSAQ